MAIDRLGQACDPAPRLTPVRPQEASGAILVDELDVAPIAPPANLIAADRVPVVGEGDGAQRDRRQLPGTLRTHTIDVQLPASGARRHGRLPYPIAASTHPVTNRPPLSTGGASGDTPL